MFLSLRHKRLLVICSFQKSLMTLFLSHNLCYTITVMKLNKAGDLYDKGFATTTTAVGRLTCAFTSGGAGVG